MSIVYPCLPCNISYENNLQIVDHKTTVHGENPSIDIEMVEIKTDDKQLNEELECQYCGAEFLILEYLAKHIASEHQRQATDFNVKGAIEKEVVNGLEKEDILESGQSFSCNNCEKSFQTKRTFRDHKRYNHGPFATCSNCSKVFEGKMQLSNHVRYNHSPKLLLSCALCGKKFSRKNDLKRHIVPCAQGKGRKFWQDPKFTCEMCSQGFVSESSLDQHVRRKHKAELLNQQTEFKKEIFDMHFTRGRRTKREVPWSCTKCSQRFKKSSNLKRHMLKTHTSSDVLLASRAGAEPEDPPNFVCHVCAKEFGSKNVLGSHLKLVHPGLTRKCDQCAKELPSTSSMQQHMRRMHNDTVFVCPLCLAEFRRNQNKRQHMKRCKWRVVTLEGDFES